MSAANIAVYVLLAIGLLAFILTALGVLLVKDFYEKVHFLAPGSLIGAIAIPAAVVVHEGLSQAGVKAILIAILLVWANPVISHATIRAGRIRRKEQWQPVEGEHVPIAAEEEGSR
ncbi:MAG: cation:proton antiporter [Bryobacteraceae bacterium]